MANMTRQTSTPKNTVSLGKQRSYPEIIELLDKNWTVKTTPKSLDTLKKLDAALGSPSKSCNAILVSGTNGKSLTIHYAAKLLKEEGLTVGAYFAPHILTYNERFCINNEAIANKSFTDIGNEVLNVMEAEGINAHSAEILALMAFLYFKQHHVDVALLEAVESNEWDPVTLCTPKVLAITRVAEENRKLDADLELKIKEVTSIAKKDSWVVSADQSKLNLQCMADHVAAQGAHWAMPIRKLTALNYPFEQLHGRCAALAERVAQLFAEHFVAKNATVVANSLLIKPKGQRGRPTLEAKRQSELHPKRTLEQFWKEETTALPGRFQLLDKEKPTLLLDNASNLDAWKNLLLGIRLLHYQRPLKGLTIIVGCQNNDLDTEEFLKLIRYFFKKQPALLFSAPLNSNRIMQMLPCLILKKSPTM